MQWLTKNIKFWFIETYSTWANVMFLCCRYRKLPSFSDKLNHSSKNFYRNKCFGDKHYLFYGLCCSNLISRCFKKLVD